MAVIQFSGRIQIFAVYLAKIGKNIGEGAEHSGTDKSKSGNVAILLQSVM